MIRVIISSLFVLALNSSVVFGGYVQPQVLFEDVDGIFKSVDSQQLSVGDVVHYTVTVDMTSDPANVQPSFAEKLTAGTVEWGKIKILWWKPAGSSGASGVNGQVLTLGLTSYSPGVIDVAPILFEKNGVEIFRTMPVKLSFAPVSGDKSKDDIYSPQKISLPLWVKAVAGLITIAFLVALVFMVRWMLRRKKAGAVVVANLSALEQFKSEVFTLKKKNLLSEQKYKPHYFAVSDSAKRFFAKRYQISAEEMTTRELISELARQQMSERSLNEWRAIFDEMDLVKFTDQVPDRQSASTLCDRALRLAEAT